MHFVYLFADVASVYYIGLHNHITSNWMIKS